MVINGALGGLVSITAGAKYVNPTSALLIGLMAGVVVVIGSNLLKKFRIDDVVDAVPVHGFCGIFGTIAFAFFPADHAFNWQQVATQATGALTAVAWAFVSGFILFSLINKTIGLRAPTDHEQKGLDYTEHAELGYPEFMSALTHRAMDDKEA
jgi:Amt family ammonium transporter